MTTVKQRWGTVVKRSTSRRTRLAVMPGNKLVRVPKREALQRLGVASGRVELRILVVESATAGPRREEW